MGMDDKIQVIVVKDDLANYKRFTTSKRLLLTIVTVFSVSLFLLCAFSIYAISKLMTLTRVEGELRDRVNQLEIELSQTQEENTKLRTTVAKLKEERRKTVEELAKRLEIINSLMKNVGIKVNSRNGEGGSAVPLSQILSSDEVEVDLSNLIPQVDQMIKKFKTVPIGYPTYGRITSSFGPRINPVTGKPEFHLGVDIANYRGTPIRSTGDGRVIKAGYCGLLGKCVEIDHGNGIRTFYGHLSKLLVHRGEKVKRGEIIGFMGNTGRSTGPHLHYAVKFKGRFVNPKIFMEVPENAGKEKGGRSERG